MEENQLLDELAAATALPTEFVKKELKKIVLKEGLNPADLTVDQLRSVMKALLLQVFSTLQN